MNKTPTPHNSAKKGEIAKEVLLAGDPMRVKYIVENLLEDYVLVNNIRGVQGYTGKYKGATVSIMAHGMGNPSMGIYAHELFNFYGVEKIVRIGTIGAMQEDINVKDILISTKTYTNTNYDNFYIKNGGAGFIEGSKSLAKVAEKIAKKMKLKTYIGATLCSDTFYAEENELEIAKENNLIGVEMECAALYLNAKKAKKQALAICTISDNVITGENMPAEEREKGLLDMAKLALEVMLNV